MKKGFGKVIWGAILIVLGILFKVAGTSVFTVEVNGVRQAMLSDGGTLACTLALIVIGAILIVTYFIPKKDK
ncbi:MAG: hypothetical protein MJZ11_09060 [Lachnospiraceae bacterium]|nr:hypothetical protein [Lachnospiraceae bacterium]